MFRKYCWGGTATKWVEKIVESCEGMKSLHLTRMTVTDRDLKMLANSPVGQALEVLKLDECDGFSTDGVLLVARLCRNLKILVMEGSDIVENDGEWLHELAVNNTVLESLSFFRTFLGEVETGDLELLAKNCSSLSSMKICYCRLLNLIGFFQAATSLEEFAGSILRTLCRRNVEEGAGLIELPESFVAFPPNLCRLGLVNLGNGELLTIYPVASRLERLDLSDSKKLDTDGHCLLLQRCPDLEILEATTAIGDRGLEIIAGSCKKMKRLKIVMRRFDSVEGWVSDRGIIAVAMGCLELEHLDVSVDVITNAALEHIGEHIKKLRVFRLSSYQGQCDSGSDFLPLDEGVGSLLKGCQKLRRLALYLPPGWLTDVGLGYIGRYSPNVRYMSLGSIGPLSVNCLNEFSEGCRRLHKLELVDCKFRLPQLSTTVLRMKCLRYLWVMGFPLSGDRQEFSGMVRPNWNFELMLPPFGGGDYFLGGILAYHSHAGKRTDFPRTQFLVPLNPTSG